MATVFGTGEETTETLSQVSYENKIFHKVENFFNCAVDNRNHVRNRPADWLTLEGLKNGAQTQQSEQQNCEKMLNYKTAAKIQSGSENMFSNGIVCSVKELPENSWDKTYKFSKNPISQTELQVNPSNDLLSSIQKESIETEVPLTCKSASDTLENTVLKVSNSTEDTKSTKILNLSTTDANKNGSCFNDKVDFKDDLKMEDEAALKEEPARSQQYKGDEVPPNTTSTLEEKAFTSNFTDEILKTPAPLSVLCHQHKYSKVEDRTESSLDMSVSNANHLAENEENGSELELKVTKNCLENSLSAKTSETGENQPKIDRCSNISNLRKHCTPCQVIVQDFFKELNIDLVELSRNFPVKHIHKRSPGRPNLLHHPDIIQNRFVPDGGVDEEAGDSNNTNGIKTKRKKGRKYKRLATNKRKWTFSAAGTADSGNFGDSSAVQDEYEEKDFDVTNDDDDVTNDDDDEEDNLPLMSVRNNLHQTQMTALLVNNSENSPACETKKDNNVTKTSNPERKTSNTIASSTAPTVVQQHQPASPKRLLPQDAFTGNSGGVASSWKKSLASVTVSPLLASESANNISASSVNVTTSPPPPPPHTADDGDDDDDATIFTTVSLTATNTHTATNTAATCNHSSSSVAAAASFPPSSSSFSVDSTTTTTTTTTAEHHHHHGGCSVRSAVEETLKLSNVAIAQPEPNERLGKSFSTTTITNNNSNSNNNSNNNSINIRSQCENLNMKTSGGQRSAKPKCRFHGLNSTPSRKLYKCKKCGLEAKCLSDIQEHMGGSHSEFCMYRCPYCVPRSRVKTINSIEFEVLRSSNNNTNVSSSSRSSSSSVRSRSAVVAEEEKRASYYNIDNNNNSSSSSSSSSSGNDNNTNNTTNTNNRNSKKKMHPHIQLQREKKRKLNYYYRNQHEIKKYKNTKIPCEYCRKLVNQSNISRHLNSKSCKGLKKNPEKQSGGGGGGGVVKLNETMVIKKYQKVKCNTCQKHISRTNLSKHCRICPKENLIN